MFVVLYGKDGNMLRELKPSAASTEAMIPGYH